MSFGFFVVYLVEKCMDKKLYDTVVVDFDTPLFSAASVSEVRTIVVEHKPTGITKQFATRTQFKESMKARNKQITEDYLIKDLQEPEPIENCLHLVKKSAAKIQEQYPFAEVIFVAGDSNNFRLDLPLPSKYKGQRTDMLRPLLLKECHKYAKERLNTVSANGYEADDLTAILAYKAKEEGKNVLMVAVDKDSKQFVDMELTDYDGSFYQKIQVMHDVELVKNNFKSYGIPWLAYQWLKGDASDNYKPTELSSVRYGDTSAYKDIKDCKTAQDVLLKVIERYNTFYPNKFSYKDWSGVEHEADWKSMLMLYFKCAKMKEHEQDDLCAGKFMAKYGVDL